MFKKFKRSIEDDRVFFSILLTLIAVASFGLGRLSAEENTILTKTYQQNAQISVKNSTKVVEEASLNISKQESSDVSGVAGQYIASKNGAKYHLPWCSGAKRIKEENKIWFNTKIEAEDAGYSSALNCKGI